MKYVFRHAHNSDQHWYEVTPATPAGHKCSFNLRDLRRWFIFWVFK